MRRSLPHYMSSAVTPPHRLSSRAIALRDPRGEGERPRIMFKFLRRPGMRSPSPAISRALTADGLPPGTNVAALGVVESPGIYSGRKVTYLRVFDPKQAAAHAV